MAQHAVGVGNSRFGAPQPVAGWAGIGTRRPRADPQRTASIDPGDRPATGAHRVDPDRWGAKRQPSDLRGRRDLRLAIPDQAHVGGRAAHVERDRMLEAGAARHGTRRDDTSGGPGQQRVHRGGGHEIDARRCRHRRSSR